MQPGNRVSQSTYVTHPWVFTILMVNLGSLKFYINKQ
ncbi:hypothetical protein DA73_0400040275 [Tolypothrix bouteillei VB521301]|uniref:Uncharacterized protein n=1 Tax=Tolypothrix bouteillei VB521301 TaxID=1479485 RepID=A0A8S9SXA8_9CYAN|nr:hypothetical protein DA73_0400040275 [Tolypothrix bouteillei VB521301]